MVMISFELWSFSPPALSWEQNDLLYSDVDSKQNKSKHYLELSATYLFDR